MKWTKRIAAILSMVIAINTVTIGAASADNSTVEEQINFGQTVESNYVEDQHDQEMRAAFEAISRGEIVRPDSFNAQPFIVGGIVRLATLIFKNVAKGAKVTVKATVRNVVTEVSAHAVERAIERGISGLQMDNVLSEKSSGMFAVEKYYDTNYSNSRIMLDRNNKVVIVIDNALNTIITTYKLDSVSTVQNRITEGRWIKGGFKFK
ncbi:DUF4258 domain-containing protein [Paenibacillus sp. DR312]|uniref:DUF4258 domain-containing protein n=1 Tax=Paenibacillus sp. DR312 TaxID=2871175 RepID=UPI001C9841FD|nr:DUF4258 domain-containing protein [Paenibacillus sp. DR312]QZN77696.1 DUF4258 domain-containing protein [Paenibacillus sp. DR312]